MIRIYKIIIIVCSFFAYLLSETHFRLSVEPVLYKFMSMSNKGGKKSPIYNLCKSARDLLKYIITIYTNVILL